MAKDIVTICDEIDALIRAFKLDEAKAQLTQIPNSKIPFSLRSRVAQLARRCDDVPRALRILAPNVYSVSEPTDQDLVEYASTVRRLGLIHQSLDLLRKVKDKSLAHLHRGFCHINVWQYREAKECLNSYLAAPTGDEYQQLVAKVNLVSTLIALSEFSEAEKLLKEILPEATKRSPILTAGLEELQAQIFFLRGETQDCLKALEKIEKAHGQQSSDLMFMVRKWRTLCRARLGQNDEEVEQFRSDARKHGQFENLRFFDLYLALIRNDQRLLHYVYFGSPSEAFRLLIPQPPEEKTFIWRGRDANKSPTFEPFNPKGLKIPFGLNLHRLMLILLSDFYRPWSVARIHDSIFCHEKYEPEVSTKKVYALVNRLQKVFNESTPLMLSTSEHGYRLRPRFDSGTLIHPRMNFETPTELAAALIESQIGTEFFSTEDVAKLLPIPKSRAPTHITRLVEDQFIDRVARGRFRLKRTA